MPEYYNFVFLKSKFHLFNIDFWHDTEWVLLTCTPVKLVKTIKMQLLKATGSGPKDGQQIRTSIKTW